MRRIEARIGELLAETSQAQRHDLTSPHAVKLHSERRQEFRTLAKAVDAGVLSYDVDGDDSSVRPGSARRSRTKTTD